MNFFKSKNFKNLNELKKFSTSKLNYKIKKSRRKEIEEELAKVTVSKNLNLEKLIVLLGKPIEKVQKKTELSKRKPKPKTQVLIIKDQFSRWIVLTSNQLRNELNDLKKYPDSKSLKQAASSILKSGENRLRKREKIINIIINRISEDKAIASLGR
ncbi:MAG: hypothetical protein ACTSUT_04710 [Promethearchaeota archaeon]